MFDMIYSLTFGGPAGASTTLTFWSYISSFRYFNMGLGSAAAFLSAFIILTLSYVYIKMIFKKIEY